MRFKAVIKDAKLSKSGLVIRVFGGDDCAADDLRMYFDETVMLSVDLIAPDAEVEYGNELYEGE